MTTSSITTPTTNRTVCTGPASALAVGSRTARTVWFRSPTVKQSIVALNVRKNRRAGAGVLGAPAIRQQLRAGSRASGGLGGPSGGGGRADPPGPRRGPGGAAVADKGRPPRTRARGGPAAPPPLPR